MSHTINTEEKTETVDAVYEISDRLQPESVSSARQDPRPRVDSLQKYKEARFANSTNGKFQIYKDKSNDAIIHMDGIGVMFLAKYGFRMLFESTVSVAAQPLVPLDEDELFFDIIIQDRNTKSKPISLVTEGYNGLIKQFIKNANFSQAFLDTGVPELQGFGMYEVIANDTVGNTNITELRAPGSRMRLPRPRC